MPSVAKNPRKPAKSVSKESPRQQPISVNQCRLVVNPNPVFCLIFLCLVDQRDIILNMVPEINNLEQLPLAERILLVEDLWDSIAQSHEADLPIPEWQIAELMRRKQKYVQDPDSAVPWPEVKRSILESKE